jgi:hypothetical protein
MRAIFEDKVHDSDNRDSATMNILNATINSLATHGGYRFVAAISTTSTFPRFGIIPKNVEDGVRVFRNRAREESCMGEMSSSRA